MAIAHIATQSAQANSSATCVTSAIDTTGANLLIATITSNGGASGFTSFVDSKGNTWQTAVDWTANGGSTDFIRIMYSTPTSVGSGHTTTLTYGALGFFVTAFAAFSGMAAASPLDKTATGTGSSTSLLTSATATTAQAEELLIGTGTVSDGANSTFTAGASYTIPANGQQGNASIGTIGFLEYRIVAATSTYTASATWGGGSGAWVAAIATFKGAGGGGGGLFVNPFTGRGGSAARPLV